MNSSKSGTVKAVSPWLGLQIMPVAIKLFLVGPRAVTLRCYCSAIRPSDGDRSRTQPWLAGSVSPKASDDIAAWEFISSRQTMSSPELMTKMGFDERKAQRVLKKLQDLRLLQRVGRGPATHYEVVQR